MRVTMEGPTALVTTTIKERLERQLDDRLITIRTDTTSRQTKDIVRITADLAAGNGGNFNPIEIEGWKKFTLIPYHFLLLFLRRKCYLELTDFFLSSTCRS